MLWQGVENIWIFACFWSCWENPSKFLRAAEKNKKVEANCTGYSAEFFGSHSVEIFCFTGKTKIQVLTTFSRSFTSSKILRTLASWNMYLVFSQQFPNGILHFGSLWRSHNFLGFCHQANCAKIFCGKISQFKKALVL